MGFAQAPCTPVSPPTRHSDQWFASSFQRSSMASYTRRPSLTWRRPKASPSQRLRFTTSLYIPPAPHLHSVLQLVRIVLIGRLVLIDVPQSTWVCGLNKCVTGFVDQFTTPRERHAKDQLTTQQHAAFRENADLTSFMLQACANNTKHNVTGILKKWKKYVDSLGHFKSEFALVLITCFCAFFCIDFAKLWSFLEIGRTS